MTELIVIPDHESIEFSIPKSYVGKKVKVTFEIENTQEEAPAANPDTLKKASDYRGILSHELVQEYQTYLKASREEWQTRI